MSREYSGRRSACQYDATQMSDQKRPYRMTAARRARGADAQADHRERRRAARWPRADLDQRHRRARRCAPLDRVPPLPGRGGALRGLLFALARGEPPPDPRAGPRSRPGGAPETALRELYAFYGRTQAMYVSLLRDESLVPPSSAGCATSTAICDDRGPPRRTGPARAAARRTRAAIGHALAFTTWRSLTREQGLADDDAVALMCPLIERAAAGR